MSTNVNSIKAPNPVLFCLDWGIIGVFEEKIRGQSMNFNQLIKQINYFAKIQRNRETYFEYLVRAYLQNEPTYQNEFKNVWMLADVPEKFNIPKTDIGVDLVAEKFTDELVAIQAKFYNHAIQKGRERTSIKLKLIKSQISPTPPTHTALMTNISSTSCCPSSTFPSKPLTS